MAAKLLTDEEWIASLKRRFDSKWELDQRTGCWLWTGSTEANGYGKIGYRRDRNEWAHRVAWELYRGEIEPGARVLHSCPFGDNPACVNPQHLWLGTQADNLEDMARKGRGTWGRGEMPPGVNRNKSRFSAQVRHKGKNMHFGTYDTPGEAALVAAAQRARLLETV